MAGTTVPVNQMPSVANGATVGLPMVTTAATTPGHIYGLAVADGYAYSEATNTYLGITKTSLTTGVSTTLAGGTNNHGYCVDSSDPTQAGFAGTIDMTTDGRNLYVADTCGIRRVSISTGATSTVIAGRYSHITVGPDGDLYAAAQDTQTNSLFRIDPVNGTRSVVTTISGVAPVVLGVAADATDVYFSAMSNQNSQLNGGAIYKYDLSTQTLTTVTTDASIRDGSLEIAGSYIYFADTLNGSGSETTIERLGKDGTGLTLAGQTMSGYADAIGPDAKFSQSLDLASDGTNLYVADSQNSAIRELKTAPIPPKSAAALTQDGPVWPSELRNGGNQAELTRCKCKVAPVSMSTGALVEVNTDLAVGGRGPGLVWSRSYDSQQAQHTGTLGYGWTGSYDMHLQVDPYSGSGSLATTPVVDVVQENGSQADFITDGNGGFVPPSRVLASLTHNPDGTWTYLRQKQTTFTFNSSGALTGITDLNGYSTILAYNGSGQLATVTDTSGRTLTFAYNGGLLASVTGPLGRQVSYTYDGSGNLQTVTDPAGRVETYGYDSSHRILTLKDPRGYTTTNTYDPSSRVLTQTDPLNHTTSFGYSTSADPTTDTVTITDPNGNIEKQVYNRGELTSDIKAVGTSVQATTSYTYDPVTNGVATLTDPKGHITHYTYDSAGNTLTRTDPLSHTTAFTYNNLNEPLTVKDALNVTTTNTYDSAGNLKTTSTPLTGTSQVQTTTYTYGDTSHPGDVTSMTDPRGKTWAYTYDANGYRNSSTDPLGNQTTSVFDALGEMSSTVAPKGNVTGGVPANFTTSYTYNNDAQVLTVTDPLGHVTTTGYDPDGNVHTVTDPNNQATTTDYDAADQPTTITRPDTTTITATYDPNGNQLTQTNGAGKTTTYTYDPFNRVASSTDPDNRTTSYTYDLAGNQKTTTNSAGKVTTATYDDANRLTGLGYSDGITPGVTEGYDADNQRTSMTDGTGTSSWSYDSLHRLTSTTNGTGLTVGYTYDLGNDVATITYPAGQVVTDSYDDAGRMTGVEDWLNRTTSFGYDPNGNLTSQTNTNGTAVTYGYDNADQATSITDSKSGTTQASFVRTPDPANLTTALTTTGTAQPNQTYGYNSLNQLTSNNSNTLTYDNTGNVTKLDNGTILAYDNASQLQTATPTSGPVVTYGFNSQGDRTSSTPAGASTTTLGYDQADRVTSYGTNVTYGYNGDGLRTSKTVSGTTTQFSYDTSGGLPLVLTDDANKYIYGPDGLPFAQVNSSGVTTWLEHDLQGSTRLLANNTGTVTATYVYTPYGATSSHTGTATTPLQYTGQYTDSETGYQYLRARYYDPATANFLTPDPLVAATGQPYSYAGGDPIDAADPSGLGFCLLGHNKNGGCRGGSEYTNIVVNYDPAYKAIKYGVQSWDDYQNGCSLLTVAKDAGESALWSVATIGFAVGGIEADAAESLAADSAAGDAAGTTAHGLTRVAGSAATRGGVLNDAEIAVVRGSGTAYLQSNGAIARVLQQADGRFSVVVDGQGGFITSFKNLSQNSLDRLAKNYDWVRQ